MLFRVQVRGLEQVVSAFRGLQTAFRSVHLMKLLANDLRNEILTRTARGVDAEGRPFTGSSKGYSKGYKLYRQKHGRSVSKVNLFWSGTMLNSLDYRVEPGQAVLFFQPTQAPDYPKGKKAKKDRVSPKSPAKAFFLQTHETKPRNFFAFSKADVERLAQEVLKHVSAEMGD
jgi:hypothetical protein